MKRTLIALTAAVALLAGGAAPASAFTVVPSPQNVTVDANPVSCEVYNIDGLNYFKLRDVAYFLKDTPSAFSVGYDAETNAVTVDTTNHTYDGEAPQGTASDNPTAVPSPQSLIFDGSSVQVEAYNINGNNYFQLRDLSSLLKVGVDYDAATNTAQITTASAEDPSIEDPSTDQPDETLTPEETELLSNWNDLAGFATTLKATVTGDYSSDGNTNIWYTYTDDKGTVAINNRLTSGRLTGEVQITGTDAVNVSGVTAGMTASNAASTLTAAGWQSEGLFNGKPTYSLDKDGNSFLLYLTVEDGSVTGMKLTGRAL